VTTKSGITIVDYSMPRLRRMQPLALRGQVASILWWWGADSDTQRDELHRIMDAHDKGAAWAAAEIRDALVWCRVPWDEATAIAARSGRDEDYIERRRAQVRDGMRKLREKRRAG
jgi:hypothetical protein